LRHLLGGRKTAVIAGLFAVLALGITPNAMAAGGAGTGTQTFCLDSGDCGTLALSVNYVNVIDRGGVVEFSCAVTLPSTDVNFIGVTITRCYVQERSSGTQHDGLQNGNAGPTTATAGGSTTLEDGGDYDVCVEGFAFYIDGERSYSDCLAPILTF
jgi:hypothetical protein